MNSLRDKIACRLNIVLLRPDLFIFCFCILFFLIMAGVSFFVLQTFPNSSDENLFLFHAKTFLQGKFWHDPHPRHEFFYSTNLVVKNGKWFSGYFPGWPLLLAGGMLIKIPPFLINPILGALSLWVLFALARRKYDDLVAVTAVCLFGFSAFFIFNGASYFSHTACSLLVLLGYFLKDAYFDTPKPLNAVCAGFFMAFAFIVRPYTALWVFLPLCLFLPFRRNAATFLIYGFLGALPVFLFLFYYQSQIIGNSFLNAISWYSAPYRFLGFVNGRTPLLAVRQIFGNFERLMIWTPPVLFVIYFRYLMVHSIRRKIPDEIDLIFISLVFGYAFFSQVTIPAEYGHFFTGGYGLGNEYGPRYYYEAFPFLVLSGISKILQEPSNCDNAVKQKHYLIMLAVSLVLSFAFIFWQAKQTFQTVWERRDVYRLVEENHIEDAVIFLKDGTGVLKPMPVPDLTRNGTAFTGSVLYAIDQGERDEELRPYFPHKKFYRYTRNLNQVRGNLLEIR